MPVKDEINDYHNSYSVIVTKPVCIKHFFVLRVMAFYAKSFAIWLLAYLMILFIQFMIYFNFNYTWHFKLMITISFLENVKLADRNAVKDYDVTMACVTSIVDIDHCQHSSFDNRSQYSEKFKAKKPKRFIEDGINIE